MSIHFVDLRILLTKPTDEMIVGKRKRTILRQFQVEIPVQNPKDAETLMDLFVVRLQELFEKLGKGEDLDYTSLTDQTYEESGAGGGEGTDSDHRVQDGDPEAAPE